MAELRYWQKVKKVVEASFSLSTWLDNGHCLQYLLSTFKLVQNPPNVKPEACKPGYVLLPGCQRVSGDLFMQEETRSSKTPVHFTSCESAWSWVCKYYELRYQEKGGRCEQCCTGVSAAKRKETCFGCRQCNKGLCNSQCHDEYPRFLYEDNLRNLKTEGSMFYLMIWCNLIISKIIVVIVANISIL